MAMCEVCGKTFDAETSTREQVSVHKTICCTAACATEHSKPAFDWEAHCASIADERDALKDEVERLAKRLDEERKWGHRLCTKDNCKSSGTDCTVGWDINVDDGEG